MSPATVHGFTDVEALPVGTILRTVEGWPAKRIPTRLAQCWDVSETWRRGNYPTVRLLEHGPLQVLYVPEAAS